MKLQDVSPVPNFSLLESHASQMHSTSEPQLHRVVFTYMHADPPTPAHVKQVQELAAHAKGDDYWVFLSDHGCLTWAQKGDFLGKLMPMHKNHIAVGKQFSHINSLAKCIQWLHKQGYAHVCLMVSPQQTHAVNKLLTHMQNKPFMHDLHIHVIPFVHVHAHKQSARMIQHAKKEQKHMFVKVSGLPEADAHVLYDLVRDACE